MKKKNPNTTNNNPVEMVAHSIPASTPQVDIKLGSISLAMKKLHKRRAAKKLQESSNPIQARKASMAIKSSNYSSTKANELSPSSETVESRGRATNSSGGIQVPASTPMTLFSEGFSGLNISAGRNDATPANGGVTPTPGSF